MEMKGDTGESRPGLGTEYSVIVFSYCFVFSCVVDLKDRLEGGTQLVGQKQCASLYPEFCRCTGPMGPAWEGCSGVRLLLPRVSTCSPVSRTEKGEHTGGHASIPSIFLHI